MFESKIVLVHATALAMQPVASAFQALWPEARCANLLDDGLSRDHADAGTLTPQLAQRITRLTQYAAACGANGILYTCSAFGPAIDASRQGLAIPVLKPNEAMFGEALDICTSRPGAGRALLLTTFAPAGQSMREEFLQSAEQRQIAASMDVLCVAGALDALNAGDTLAHSQLIAQAAREAMQGCDVLLLGQFSMACAKDAVQAISPVPVLSSPESAVRLLKTALSSSPLQLPANP